MAIHSASSWFKSSELEDPFPSQELISGRTAPCEKSASFRGALKEKIDNCGVVSGALTRMLGRPRPGTCTVTSIPGSDPMEIKPNQIWRKEREAGASHQRRWDKIEMHFFRRGPPVAPRPQSSHCRTEGAVRISERRMKSPPGEPAGDRRGTEARRQLSTLAKTQVFG